MVETSEDEALILGTANAHLRFAAEILEKLILCLDRECKRVDFDGEEIPFVAFGESSNGEAHVVIRSMGVAASQEQVKTAIGLLMDQ